MEFSAPVLVQSNTSLLNTHFCLLLSNQILFKGVVFKSTNLVVSPLSLHILLSLVAAGSKGRTLEQLLFFLRSTSVSYLNLLSSQIVFLASLVEGSDQNNEFLVDHGPLLSFVNGAWVDQRFKLKPSFEGIVKRSCRAQLENVDFLNKAEEALEEVNFWAENASNGLIKECLPSGSLNSETAPVLANALYFKGTWDQEFDPSRTHLRDFHLLNGQSFGVPFMTTERNVNHLYGSFDGYKVVQIPYKSGQDSRRFSMYFFLPNEKHGLPNLIQTLKFKSDFFYQQLKLMNVHLSEFWIPKFKFSFKFEASEIMKEMGLKFPFTDGEVTEMVDCLNCDKFYVSNIFHHSHIEVNEESTEAVAIFI
ncbi:hypothetical protein FNV43_RR06158 [Rhamnella rubrinervis]|uniref:Serpin domain-containing protein n=1 Tax=Rhamnella rubrinervis TaxID=2594499 RepID=A0A8K0HDE8_9ROSA|nr:hypothetical protein FNV43_RR06158 [Rhamnella rubrinervis]